MKIFLDTADRTVIKHWAETGIIDGVTTNPSHLFKAQDDPKKVVKDICALLPNGDISVEITETAPDAVFKQARAISDLAKNVIVKVPCHRDYYAIIKKLVLEGVHINITLVFTLIQGLCMAKLGVRYISPFVGRWDDIDVDGIALLYELRAMIDQYDYETEILAASLRHVRHVHEAICAGADAITVPAAVLEKATTHPLTDAGMQKFLADWQQLGVTRFP